MNLEPPWQFLDRQQIRLTEFFLIRRATLMSEEMLTDTTDVCALTPSLS